MKLRVRVLSEQVHEFGHRLFELGFEGVGRIDHKHTAAWQAGPLLFGAIEQLAGQGRELGGFDDQGGMQPIAFGVLGHGFKSFGQVVCFGPGDERVPDQVGARCKAFQRVLDAHQDFAVIGFDLIARIHHHQGSALGRWQKFLHALKAIGSENGHLSCHLELRHVLLEQSGVGGVQLKEFEFVKIVEQMLNNEGRAGVEFRFWRGVEVVQQGQILFEEFGFCQLGLGQDPLNALLRLLADGRELAVHAVKPSPRVGINDGQRDRLVGHVFDDGDEDGVLEHIRMVSCMKGVSITKHMAVMVTVLVGLGSPRVRQMHLRADGLLWLGRFKQKANNCFIQETRWA